MNSDLPTAAMVDDAAHGKLVLNLDGSFSYKPDAGYIGSDQFTYLAADDLSQSTPATVTINVYPEGAKPTLILLPVVIGH